MSTRLSLGLAALVSILTAVLNLDGSQPLVDLLGSLALGICAYAWYRADSIRHRYLGSSLLAGGIILLAVLAIPYYLFRSRLPGMRAKAIGLFALSVFGLMLASAATVLTLAGAT